MRTSRQLAAFDVREISNGFIVSSGPDPRRGGSNPREHFCDSIAAVGAFIAGETQRSSDSVNTEVEYR